MAKKTKILSRTGDDDVKEGGRREGGGGGGGGEGGGERGRRRGKNGQAVKGGGGPGEIYIPAVNKNNANCHFGRDDPGDDDDDDNDDDDDDDASAASSRVNQMKRNVTNELRAALETGATTLVHRLVLIEDYL